MNAPSLQRVQEALAAPLAVAGVEERVAIPAEELRRFHMPLARELAARAGAAPSGRALVALVGVPGSGKSVFAAVMERVLGVVAPEVGAKAIGIDGYHLPNATLDALPAPDGGSLRAFKGAPFTFDVPRLAADLRRLRAARHTVRLPAYDRARHDPADEALAVTPANRLLLVEGNWLLYDRDGWEQVHGLFDLSLFLALPPGAHREPLLARHQRGGRSRQDALKHYERVDRPNAALVAATRHRAQMVIELDARYAVRAIHKA